MQCSPQMCQNTLYDMEQIRTCIDTRESEELYSVTEYSKLASEM